MNEALVAAQQLREETRALWSWVVLEQLAQDVRYAVRMMLKSPVLSGLAILSLGLGIGANTTIFSVTNALLLHSVPVAEPSRLLAV